MNFNISVLIRVLPFVIFFAVAFGKDDEKELKVRLKVLNHLAELDLLQVDRLCSLAKSFCEKDIQNLAKEVQLLHSSNGGKNE